MYNVFQLDGNTEDKELIKDNFFEILDKLIVNNNNDNDHIVR